MLKKFFLLLVLLISCASYRGYADGLNFQTTVTLSNGGLNFTPTIGFEPVSKNFICVWANNDISSIQSIYSTDGGATFSTPAIIGEGFVPYIGFDGAGKTFVIFRSLLSTAVMGAFSIDGGITYSTPIQIASNGGTPQIFFDSHSGHWVALFTGSGGSFQTSYSADGGHTFSTPIIIDTGVDVGVNFGTLAFDPVTHNGALVWRKSATIYAAYTTDGGVTFSTPVALTTDATHDSIAKIAFDPVSGTSNGIVIWIDNSGVLLAAHTSNGGVTYETAKDVFSQNPTGADPKLGFNPISGNAVILANTNTGVKEVYSADGGITFSTPIVLLPISSNREPALAFDTITGYTYASWFSNIVFPNGFLFVAYSTDGGVTFSTPVSIAITNPNESPRLASSLNTVVVWPSNFGGGDIRILAAASFFVESSTLSAFGKQQFIKGLFQTDIVNAISWNSIPTAQMYKVRDANNNLLFQGNALIFYDHGKKQGQNYTYFVSWINQFSQEVGPVSVTIP